MTTPDLTPTPAEALRDLLTTLVPILDPDITTTTAYGWTIETLRRNPPADGPAGQWVTPDELHDILKQATDRANAALTTHPA